MSFYKEIVDTTVAARRSKEEFYAEYKKEYFPRIIEDINSKIRDAARKGRSSLSFEVLQIIIVPPKAKGEKEGKEVLGEAYQIQEFVFRVAEDLKKHYYNEGFFTTSTNMLPKCLEIAWKNGTDNKGKGLKE